MEFSSFVQLCQEAPNQTLLNLEKGNVEKIIAEMHMIGATDSSHLINYVNTRFKFKNSRAPLHVVSAFSGQSHLDLAALLIQNNADINCQDSSGATPLHVAAAHNNTNMVSVLCKREDIRLNMTDRNGFTPLHIAIQSDSLDSALLLLTAGACTTIQPPPPTGTRHCQPVATPASLIINKHKSAPREWDVLNTLVNAEARFNELVCDEAVAAVVRVFQFPHHRRIWFNRLTELTGSLIHHSRSIVHSPPVLTSDVQSLDSLAAFASDDLSKLRDAADAANVKLVFDTVEQLYRSKHLKLMPSQSQLPSGLKFSLETLESLSFSDFAKPPDCSKTVSAWFKDKSRLLPHHGFLEQFMSKVTSKLIAAGNSTVQCLDKHIALVSRVAVKHSVLRKVSLAASLMPCLESLAFHHVKFVSDIDGQQTFDWFPIFLQTLTTCHSLHGDTSHQEVPFSVQKLSVNNCKLRPSMLYASMTLPDGITELDFSCNPDLAMSGASYILSALPQNQIFSNDQRMRRICFSRCTSRSSARDVGDCHVFKFAENLGKFSSLEHFDISFNFFDASHFSCILSHVPKSVTQLHLSGIELFDDFNEFATAVNNCLRSNGPTLSTLMLSHSPTMVQPPPSVSCCGMLSYLDISFCRNLKCIPSEVFLPSLEVLIASNNPSLEEISLQPGRKLSLSLLNLSSCSALQTLPDELYAPSLEVLLLACNISLKNIAKTGCEIVNAVNLKRIDLSQCEQLTSLPDQLASKNLVNLENILISGCTNMLYPPYKAMKTTQHIKDYLNAAKDQPPLKRVKVVLLGNGRSGKTSLLGSLKKLELDADCPSTKGVQVCPQDESDNLQSQRKLKSFAQFVGAGISNLAPEVTYWDFAGQLEYSATHDFFMSSRQAVYIIVFSVVEPPSSQADQVRYWLNTILERYSKHIRIIIVGTKIDLLDTQLKKDGFQDLNQFRKVALKRSEILMRQLVDSMTCNYNLSFTIPILFSTADKKQCYSLWKEKREALKRQITHFSRDIFIGCDGELRFPAVHKELFHEVQELALCNPHKPVISLDDECITAKFKLLHALRGTPDGRSLQSLDVLSDVGLLVHYKCGGQVYICPTPQYVADIVGLLADPDRICQPVFSEHELRDILYLNSDLTKCQEGNIILANQLIDFFCVIRLLTPIKTADGSAEPQFLIPLQLRGRPALWRDCAVPVDTDVLLKATRFKLSRGMFTVPAFLRLMSELCHDIAHMWGCAFVVEISSSAYVFVRLSEDRSAVDVVSLVYSMEEAQHFTQFNETYEKILTMLNCSQENSFHVALCPHCTASNHYMRSGNADEFFTKQFDTVSSTQLRCRRHHEPSAKDVMTGTRIRLNGLNTMPMLFPGTESDCIPWVPVSAAGITQYVQSDDPVDNKHAGIVLPNSFFALSKQMEAGAKMNRANLEELLVFISKNAPSCPVEGSGDGAALQLHYSVGESIGHQTICRILDFLSPLIIAQEAITIDRHRAVLKTTLPHGVSPSQSLVIDTSLTLEHAAYGFGVVVCEVIDNFRFCVAFDGIISDLDWEGTSFTQLVHLGTKLYPLRPHFTVADNVIVVFDKQSKPRFTLFPGSPDADMKVAFLTQQNCCSGKLGTVWSEVEDHWAVMLGNEYQNYEIDSLILFCNQTREQQFLREVDWLRTTGQARPNPYKFPYEAFSCASDNGEQKALRSNLQRQVLSHFHDFQSKFCLRSGRDNDGTNLSVVWWGNRPEAHYSVAQNGFQHLPPSIKIDEGYFGEGFYLTRYPRYSDYYTSGCKLSSRHISGCILMSFAALGRPYPVTQDPFTYQGGRVVEANDSLYGRRCGERCSCFSGSSSDGVPNHDCHFASVKLQTVKGNPVASKSFYPCPLRQEPEYDEIVLFKSERVCPVAHVSFTRRWLSRSRMLLWLHEAKDSLSELKSFSIAGFSEKNFDDLQAEMGDGHGEVTAMHAAITISSASLAAADAAGETAQPTQLHGFTTVEAITAYLTAHPELIRYPPSLFRIISSRGLYQGSAGLGQFFDTDSVWSSAYPSVLVFQRDTVLLAHAAAVMSRPRVTLTTSSEVCRAFASFVAAERS